VNAATFELQQALHAHLSADEGLKALLGDPPRIYDDPPADSAFPYLVIGETRAQPVAGADALFEHDLRLQVFSRHAGRRDVKRVLDAVYDALQDAALAVESARIVSFRFVFSDVLRREAEVYSGVARYRVVTEALS
jgi:hypothetical protein